MNDVKKIVILSAVTVLMLSSNAYAGMIKTDAGDPQNPTVEENTQFGFGGWNFENIDVKMVNLDGSPTTATFNTVDGTYTPMSVGMSFESDIYGITYVPGGTNTIGTTVMGQLHGKDWPVGEPAGIKVINDDTQMKHGKPQNCIMTSSYLEYQVMVPVLDDASGTGYLDAWPTEPNPVICSSPWQTHKRYKINLLPTTVEDVTPGNWGKPVDVLFKLDSTDTDATPRRYQVLQKANNYTGMRLDGIKIEVLDENGTKNDALTLSLGEGEGDEGANIWAEDDMANMSHGLWGPYEVNDEIVRFDNGFFDYKRVYFDVDLNVTDNNRSISYIGDMLGGNYQDLFGNWLPSIWEPTGVFFDEDENPATDNILQAFLGVAPGFTERAWYKRSVVYDPDTPNVDPVYTWELATEEDFAQWSGEWYNEGPIEDVLNLGLNYIINVGLNADIGDTFTLRITPHVDTNQTPPSSYILDPGVVEDIGDFNSDGIDDILWRNYESNDITVWYMEVDGNYTEAIIGATSDRWELQGTADFDGNGAADILWRGTDQSVGITYMNTDGSYLRFDLIGNTSSRWIVKDAADFDGNGAADILWRGTDQSVGITYLNTDGSYLRFDLIGTTSSRWAIEGSGDFDGNTAADILWRSTEADDTVGVTYLNTDGSYLRFDPILVIATEWEFSGIGDFDGNSVADILWRDATNQTAASLRGIGGTDLGLLPITKPDLEWVLQDVGDLDGNGVTDILWRSVGNQIGVTYISIGGMVKSFEIIETLYE